MRIFIKMIFGNLLRMQKFNPKNSINQQTYWIFDKQIITIVVDSGLIKTISRDWFQAMIRVDLL